LAAKREALSFQRAKDSPDCRTTSDSRPQAVPKIRDGLVTTRINDDDQFSDVRGRFAFTIVLRLKTGSFPKLFEFNFRTKLHPLDAKN
jgi:hypothetical protein